MSEVLNSQEAALSAATSALAAFSPSAEAPAADVVPAFSEGVAPIVKEADAPTLSLSGFVLNGQKYKVRFDGAGTSSAADPTEIPPAPELPPIPGADEYEQACTQKAIQPPRRMLFTRQWPYGIDEFAGDTGETSWLPSGNAKFNPVMVNGKLCDPAVVERTETSTILLGGNIPKRIKFDGFWTRNGNRRTTVNVAYNNDFVDKICRRVLKRTGEAKGKVQLTLAALALADSNGKIERSDPYAVYTYSSSARCKEPRKLERKILT